MIVKYCRQLAILEDKRWSMVGLRLFKVEEETGLMAKALKPGFLTGKF